MFNKFSTLVVFLILGLVAPIFASSPCNCQTLPSHVGTIIGDLDDLIDEVVSDVIEPVGSVVSSLVDNLLSELDLDNVLGGSGGLLGGNGGLGGILGSNLLGSNGIDLGDVVSEVDDLVDDLLDIDSVDISLCVGLDLLQNNLFYKFNSGHSNHLVLYGFSSGIVLNVGLFTGGCDDLTCVHVDLDFCGNNNDLAVVIQPNTDYYIGIFGAPCDYIINYELSCHGRCN